MKLVNFAIAFLFFGMGLSLTSIGQHDYEGCHFHRNSIKHKPLTEAQKRFIQDSNARSDTFDILHYDISLDVTRYNDHFLRGITTVQFTPKMENLDHIVFDLKNLQVDSVLQGEEVLYFVNDSTHLSVDLGEVPSLEDTISVIVYYHGNPVLDPEWGGFYFAAGYIYNLGIGLSTIPPNFGKVWYPCFDSFVERATYSYHVKTAGGKKAYCQGDFMGEDILLGDTVIRHYDFNQPIPTFLSAIAAAEYETYTYEHPGEYGTIPITLTARSNNMASMQAKFEALGQSIDALEYWYGPYIWGRVGYVLTTDGALEIPTNIAYPSSMMNTSTLNNGLLFSHELGHQWWGNVVTPSLHNDMWIKEGPAEYSSHLFVEWTQGEVKFIKQVKDNQLFVLESAHIADEGFWPLSPIPDEYIYGRHTYYKGAAVMHNLRGYLGDSLFRQTMHQVQALQAYTNVDAEGFKEYLEEASGYDLTSFFNDWVYSPGFSTFVVDSFVSVPQGNQYNNTVYLHQKLRAAPNFHTQVPIELAAVKSDWSEQIFEATADGEFSIIEVQTNYLPEYFVFNPRNKLNGARMDQKAVLYPDEPFNHMLNYADMRIRKEEVTDSTLVYVNHIWSAPEPELGEFVDEISSTHYWEVTGIFPEGTNIEGRIYYHGNNESGLDVDLASVTEEGMIPVYRASPDLPWEEYDDYEPLQGGLTNGSGSFKLFHLKKGQYAFAKGQSFVATDQLDEKSSVVIYPNPTKEWINLQNLTPEMHRLQIYDNKGSKIKDKVIHSTTVSLKGFTSGTYVLVILNKNGEIEYQKSIEVLP